MKLAGVHHVAIQVADCERTDIVASLENVLEANTKRAIA